MKKAGREKSGKGAAIAATAGEATLFEIGGREKRRSWFACQRCC